MIDLCFSKLPVNIKIDERYELEHDSLMLRWMADKFQDAPHLSPNLKRVNYDHLSESIDGLKDVEDSRVWRAAQGIVNSLPKKRFKLRTRPCRYWTSALDVMMRDIQ